MSPSPVILFDDFTGTKIVRRGKIFSLEYMNVVVLTTTSVLVARAYYMAEFSELPAGVDLPASDL